MSQYSARARKILFYEIVTPYCRGNTGSAKPNKKGSAELSCKSDRRKRMKKIIFGIALMVATVPATPVFAQAYCACWGTGNVSNEPLIEKSNGAVGYEMSAAPRRGTTTSAKRLTGNSAYAYSPVPNANRHMKHKQRQ